MYLHGHYMFLGILFHVQSGDKWAILLRILFFQRSSFFLGLNYLSSDCFLDRIVYSLQLDGVVFLSSLGEISFRQVCWSVWYVFCLYVCPHATGRIFRSISTKFHTYMWFIYRKKPIVFRQHRIQNGGSAGHFVSSKILKNS